MKIGFLGAGAMAGAMLQKAVDAGFDCMYYDLQPKEYPVPAAKSAEDLIAACEVIQLGVKPQVLPALLKSVHVSEKLVLSIAAGVTLETITQYAPRAVRLMPNMNAAVGEAMTAVCAAEAVTAEELCFVKSYCAAFGQVIELPEKQFSAFTALAGSGPAFVYTFIDALAHAGVSAGLTRADALAAATQTVLGSAKTLSETGAHPAALADKVCSPGGTTIAGMLALAETGFAHAVHSAVLAAVKRDQELGK